MEEKIDIEFERFQRDLKLREKKLKIFTHFNDKDQIDELFDMLSELKKNRG